ncbi:MAG: ATP-binding cassette domain-containing protein [Candidatus Nanopelagicales bacterium]|nr:ATP-binding cassette domain-containing protein [Candidatus Nanopelagicales bacterium]
MNTADIRHTLDATEILHLTPGTTVRVVTGTVVVFVVPRTDAGPGRRIPVCEVTPPSQLTGAQVEGADLVGVGLPGTQVEPVSATDDAAEQAMARSAREALSAANDRNLSAADLLRLSARHDERLIDDALLGLAAAVPGQKPDLLTSGDLPDDVAVVEFMARQIGLRPNPLLLRRAVADVEITGRDTITSLAAASGAAVRRVGLTPGWWRQEGPPLLLQDRHRATYGAAVWRRGAYHVWEPTLGLHAALDAATAAPWSREAILFEPLLDPNRPARIRDLVRLGLRGSKKSLWLVAMLTAIVGVLAAVIPIVAGQLTSTVASQTGSTLLVVGVALVAFAAGDMALRAVRLYAMLRIRGRGVAVTATAVWDRLIRLPMSWQNQRTVASRMTDANAVDTASMSMSNSVITSLLDISAVVGAMLGVATTSLSLATALLAFLVVRAVVELLLVRRAARLTREVLDASTESQSVTLGLIAGVSRLRVSGATGRAFALWATSQTRTTATEVRQRRLTVAQQMTGALWPSAGLAVLLAVTAAAGTSVGSLVTAQTALTAATSAVAAAVASVGAGLSARAVLERARSVLRAEPESGTGQEVAQLAGSIDLRDLVFSYRPDTPPVLRGVSFAIPAGAHVAVVGPSGCGKSTLLRLVLGLENPESGIVSFDGRDLSALDRSSVRRQIGSVMQSSALMPGSIRENVDLGRGLSAAQIWQALADAAVAEDVRAMPMGLATVVVEGTGAVSGGQRQRILLARALAGKPRILILDEATSALDNVSQAAVVANLDRLDITRVVVAHRLSTIEQADLVVMLTDGVVVAEGKFAELMARPGPFHDLIERQQL